MPKDNNEKQISPEPNEIEVEPITRFEQLSAALERLGVKEIGFDVKIKPETVSIQALHLEELGIRVPTSEQAGFIGWTFYDVMPPTAELGLGEVGKGGDITFDTLEVTANTDIPTFKQNFYLKTHRPSKTATVEDFIEFMEAMGCNKFSFVRERGYQHAEIRTDQETKQKTIVIAGIHSAPHTESKSFSSGGEFAADETLPTDFDYSGILIHAPKSMHGLFAEPITSFLPTSERMQLPPVLEIPRSEVTIDEIIGPLSNKWIKALGLRYTRGIELGYLGRMYQVIDVQYQAETHNHILVRKQLKADLGPNTEKIPLENRVRGLPEILANTDNLPNDHSPIDELDTALYVDLTEGLKRKLPVSETSQIGDRPRGSDLINLITALHKDSFEVGDIHAKVRKSKNGQRYIVFGPFNKYVLSGWDQNDFIAIKEDEEIPAVCFGDESMWVYGNLENQADPRYDSIDPYNREAHNKKEYHEFVAYFPDNCHSAREAIRRSGLPNYEQGSGTLKKFISPENKVAHVKYLELATLSQEFIDIGKVKEGYDTAFVDTLKALLIELGKDAGNKEDLKNISRALQQNQNVAAETLWPYVIAAAAVVEIDEMQAKVDGRLERDILITSAMKTLAGMEE